MSKTTFRVTVTHEDDIDHEQRSEEVEVEMEGDTLIFPPWTFDSNSWDHSKPTRIDLHNIPE